jgi:hypothetical protein
MMRGIWLVSVLILSSLFGGDLHARDSDSVLFFAGQSREEFADYIGNVCDQGKRCPLPAGAAFYTSLHGNGFDGPHANMPGDNHQDFWYLQTVYQPLILQVALWMGADELSKVNSGEFDAKISQLITRLENSEQRVLLRIGYEFDGPHNRYQPTEYVAAYRRIAKQARRADNIELVWHSFAMLPTYQERDVMEWYPGDRFVDWFAISYFQVGKDGYHAEPNRQRIIALAREKKKPVMIAEASAIRYTVTQKQTVGKSYWDYWYQPFFDLIESTPEIKAVSMINVNWDSQAQHQLLEWGDARIASDPYVLKRWREKMNKPYWK